MGKLNYSARKIEGEKVTQVAIKDLLTEKKKRITTTSGLRASSRDPTLEIDVSEKGITDTGFDAFLTTLLECMHFRDAEHPDGAAKVTELHLNGNQLSVQSLSKLTEVVALSGADLRELDLADNCVQVQVCDEEAKRVWLAFLKAFEGCFVLKKLDFSRNVLGIAGVEMLARAFLQSGLDFVEGEGLGLAGADGAGACGDDLSGCGNVTSGSGEDDLVDDMAVLSVSVNGQNQNQNQGQGQGHSQSHSQNGNGRKKSPGRAKGKQNGTTGSGTVKVDDMKRYTCKRGLRSVPYIVVTDICMTTGAAVHLASMVLVHKYPETLLDYLPGNKIPVLPRASPNNTYCSGLIYLPNDGMGAHGQRLLQSAETLRRFAAATDPDEDQMYREDKMREFECDSPMDFMEQRRQHAKLLTDYSRIAKRVRLDALLKEGVEASGIWNAAFKMITYSRTLLMNATLGFGEVIEWKDDEEPSADAPSDAPSDVQAPEQAVTASSSGVGVSEQDTHPHPLAASHSHPETSCADESATDKEEPLNGESGPSEQRPMTATEYFYYNLLKEPLPLVNGPFRPGAAEFEANFPALPVKEQPSEDSAKEDGTTSSKTKGKKKPRQRKSTSSGASDSPHKPSCPCSKTQDSKQNDNVLSCMCPSSFEANRDMVAFAADADGILTTAQQGAILRYATDWQSIEAERKAQGAEEYQHVWKLLESVDCFTYSCS